MADQNDKNWWRPAVEIFSQVSVWVVVPIVAALVIGKYLDWRFGTAPWLFLGLTGLAFLMSCFGIVRTVSRYIKEIQKENGSTGESK